MFEVKYHKYWKQNATNIGNDIYFLKKSSIIIIGCDNYELY